MTTNGMRRSCASHPALVELHLAAGEGSHHQVDGGRDEAVVAHRVVLGVDLLERLRAEGPIRTQSTPMLDCPLFSPASRSLFSRRSF